MTNYENVKGYLHNNQYTWLVTGCAGFIGSNLLEELLTLNQKVIGLDNFETGFQSNIDEAIDEASKKLTQEKILFNKDNFTFIEGDITSLRTCRKATDSVDYVLHQAALGSVPRSIKDPIKSNSTNIDGFLNMLVASRDAKVSRFIYAASSSSYGDHPNLPKVEDKIGNLLSPYAVTKYVNELYASVFAKTYNFKTIGLRYFNVFGKRQNPNGAYAAVIPKWISSILKGEQVIINGDGQTTRDFCYIKNTVQINILAALVKNEEAIDQVYNVALNDQTSLDQLYQMIDCRVRKIKPSISCIKPLYQDFRPGDVRHSRADITKAQQLLGYEPSHKISEGLDEAMGWYINLFSK